MRLTLRDDLGRTVTLPNGPARRIVSLAPEVTENLFALGAGSLLVGVTTADTYPAAALKIVKVGDFGQPSFERIRALRPDLVIAASATIPRSEPDRLQQRLSGIPIFAQKSARFADVLRHLQQLGAISGRSAEAQRLVAQMQAKAAQASKQAAGKPKVTVFVEVSPSPLYAAGPGSFVDDLIQRAGGVNIVKGSNPFPVYSKEALLASNPQHYVMAVGGDMNAAATTPAGLPAALASRLRAVKEGHVHRISSDLLFRATPRLADGLMALTKALHR
ncbi:MAG: helical backbone metal receptor [Armatimonadota bacterium]